MSTGLYARFVENGYWLPGSRQNLQTIQGGSLNLAYIVKDKNGKVVAVCTKLSDAEGIAATKLDEMGPYTVEKQ